jgi:arylsulfatase A-like enzyme
LIASGPSFASGLHSELPSGNIDIAPTVLELLGIPLPEHFDGRVLHEALESGHELESSLAAQSVSRSPSITSVTVGDTCYLCEFG